MKRKVIRVCSLVLLSVAVSGALVGCGSKSEKDTAASSTTSTSKVAKSSPNTSSLLKRPRQKLQRIFKAKKKRALLKQALQKIKLQLEMMLKEEQVAVLLLSQTSLVKQQLILKVMLLFQQH